MTTTDPEEIARAQRRQIRAHRRIFTVLLSFVVLALVFFWRDLFADTPLSRFGLLVLAVILGLYLLWRRLTTSPGRFSARGREDGRGEGWYWW
jgi:hypothetical protein